jgi:hypothetical protein
MVTFTDASACQRIGGLLLALLGALALPSCGPLTHATPAAHSRPSSAPQLITFDSGISYTQALREVTDHGIQPGKPCPPEWQVGRSLTSYAGVWQPQGQADAFAQSHQLYVWFPATTGDIEFGRQITKLAHVLSVSTPSMTVQGIPGMPAVAPGDIVCSAVLGALPAGTRGYGTAPTGSPAW